MARLFSLSLFFLLNFKLYTLIQDKVVEPLKKPSRKMAKDLKGKRKRVKGTAKSKVQAGKQKR